MRKICFLSILMFIVVFACAIAALANQNDDALSQKIIAEGRVQISGNDESDKLSALTEAKKTAIKKAMESLIERDLIIKNDNTINDNIFAFPFEYIEEYDVNKDGKKDDYYFVEISAQLFHSKLIKKLIDLDILHPERVAVIITEYVGGKQNKKLAACKTGIEDELVEAGQNVIHDRKIEEIGQTDTFDELLENSELITKEAIKKELIDKSKADILIIGSAQSSLLSDEPIVETQYAKIYSARAIGTFKMFRLDDGEILAVVSDIQSAADVSPDIAMQKALKNLGERAGDELIDKMIYHYYLQVDDEDK